MEIVFRNADAIRNSTMINNVKKSAMSAPTWLVCAVMLLAAASGAAGADSAGKQPEGYQQRWQGALIGGECYFSAVKLLKGDFISDPGEELLAMDEDGYAHLIRWTVAGFEEVWVAPDPVAPAGIRKAVAADLDGKGGDAAVILDGSGSVIVWGGEKGKFQVLCRDCLAGWRDKSDLKSLAAADSGDGARQDIVAWARRGKRNYLLRMEWKGKGFELLFSKTVEGARAVEDLFAPEKSEAAEKYYIYENGPGNYRGFASLAVDEEGAVAGERTPLTAKNIVAAGPWMGKWYAIDRAVMFLEKVSGKIYLKVENPYEKTGEKRVGPAPAGTQHAFTADLNGDGTDELVFAGANCRIAVFARQQLRLVVDGRDVDPEGRVRISSDGQVFIDAELIRNFRLKREQKFATMYNNKFRLVFDFDTNRVLLYGQESEEAEEVEIPFINTADRLFIDPVSAADRLGFGYTWDLLSQALELKFNVEGAR